jgi:hypothetical protein
VLGRWKGILSIITVATILAPVLAVPLPVAAAGTWWSKDFARRVEVTIKENSGALLTDYQVKVTVPFDTDMQPDFDDIRFVDTAELSYWRNSYTSSGSATFWVKVPSIPASGTKTIYMYYGNATVSTTSDIHAAFIWGDDFEDATWTGTNVHQVNYANTTTNVMPTQYIESGLYHQEGPTASEPIAEIYQDGALKAFPDNYIAEVEIKPVVKLGAAYICPRYASVANKYENLIDFDWNNAVLNKVVATADVPFGNYTNINGTWLGAKLNSDIWNKLGAVVLKEGTTNRLKVVLNDEICLDQTDPDLKFAGLAFLTYNMEAEFHCSYDNFRVRQYVAVEPSVSFLTGEETNVVPITPTPTPTPGTPATVSIAVRPGSEKSPINIKSNGVVPVAVLGSNTFNVKQVNVSSVRFGPAQATAAKFKVTADINKDGFSDAVFFFETQSLGFKAGDTMGVLNGQTAGGQPFTGTDDVTVISNASQTSLKALVSRLLEMLKNKTEILTWLKSLKSKDVSDRDIDNQLGTWFDSIRSRTN